jgi:hypothetical protein
MRSLSSDSNHLQEEVVPFVQLNLFQTQKLNQSKERDERRGF